MKDISSPTVSIAADRQSAKHTCDLRITDVSHRNDLTELFQEIETAGFKKTGTEAQGSDGMIVHLELEEGTGIGPGHLSRLENAIANAHMEVLK